jgi:hypothetical protein
MKLLLDSRNLIRYINTDIELGVWDDTNIQKWRIGNYYVIGEDFTLVEVETLPLDVIPDKYFYIDGEFIANPNYVGRSDIEQRLASIEYSLLDILAKLERLTNTAQNT